MPLAAFEGQPLAQVAGLETFGAGVQTQFDEFLSERKQHGLDHWQQSYELNAAQPGSPQHAITVVARGAEMPPNSAGEAARLLVFDDISEIVSAQRAQAWGEVARRLAHEIKNPLTPIQLSAERLEMKLTGKVAEPERALLEKSVRTIVEQVDAMKRLVNEFRDYARLPAAELSAINLNALVGDVLQLYAREGSERIDAASQVPIRMELEPECPRILGDAQQLRQVIHNLLQNAQDATEGAATQEVVIRTEWNAPAKRVRLIVQDTGSGFPEHILKRAFEPYVTTKPKGTGLGLVIVKKIIEEHGGSVEIANTAPHGARVTLKFPAAVNQTAAVKVVARA